MGATCKIDDCDKPAIKRGWCGGHYLRWYKYGDPLGGSTGSGEAERFFREVVLTDGRGPSDPCLIWPYSRSPGGYGQLRLDGHLYLVSRLACEEVNGPPPTDDHEAAHSCGCGGQGCATKSHLSWKTHKENDDDKDIHGTRPRGERCSWAKLTEPQAREIMALKGQASQRKIAEQFGVSQTVVSKIHREQIWVG